YLFNDAEVKPFDSAQLASECFGGEMTVWDAVALLMKSLDATGTADIFFYLPIRLKPTTLSLTSLWTSPLRRFMWQLCSSIPSTLPDPKAVSLMTAKMFQRLCIHVIQRLRPVHAHLYLQPGMEDGYVSAE
ncbi:hypothetical protein GOODEAATRI_029872, partial [Goodea atripinnis]